MSVSCGACEELVLPASECHRVDVAHAMISQGLDCWCPACGRFWKGTEEDLLNSFENLEK